LEGSYDFNDHRQLPKPTLSDDFHGTRCAGQVAAAINDSCGVGIAYDAKVSGIRILSGALTEADEAASLNYKFQDNHIYSCSWGPSDDGKTCEGPSKLVSDAFKNGIEKGRGNKGSIYVFATGNGGVYGDNCNFDGYTNSIYTISIGAIDSKNEHPVYSEPCSAQIAVTYSSGYAKKITTTDVSVSNLSNSVCTSNHGGTSAAAPIAAGIFALVLSVRPDLTWRDLQRLAIESAVPVSTDDPDWVKTINGRMFNHKFGYGKLDTEILIKNAKEFKLLNKQTSFESPVIQVNEEFQGNTQINSSIFIKQEDVKNFKHLEHVNVKVNLNHQRRGDVIINLISPHGIVSNVATSRRLDSSDMGLKDWLFMSVKHWDEDPIGEWILQVQNEKGKATKGKLIDWTLILWGEEIGEDVPYKKLIEPFNKIFNEKNYKIIVAAIFSLSLVAAAGIGLILWKCSHKRNNNDDIEFQRLEQQNQLMEEEDDDDDDNYDIDEEVEEDLNDNLDKNEKEIEMQNKIIFENHFLEDDDEETDNLDIIELSDVELLSQSSV